MTGPPRGRRSPPWVRRVTDGSITQLRAEYTFALARLCACPPPAALQLDLLDFGRLIDGIDHYMAARRAPDLEQ